MDNQRPKLNAQELQQLQWLLGGVLSLFAIWSVFYLDVEALGAVLAATAGVGAALLRPGLPARVPGWLHKAAFPLIVAGFVFELWAEGQVLPAMIRLDLWLILYRGISYRGRREDLQLIVLGMFLVVVAGVLTVSVAFAAQIVVFAACALLLLFLITLNGPAPGVGAAVVAPNVRPAWVGRMGHLQLLRRVIACADLRLVVMGGALFAGVVVLSGLLFMAIPRFQFENSLFLDGLFSGKARSGFSENVRFGEVTEITQDTGVALRVDVSDAAQVPAALYLRMLALDEYDPAGGFRLSKDLRRAAFASERTVSRLHGPRGVRLAGRSDAVWTFYLEPGVSRYLPLPGVFSQIQFREVQAVQLSPSLLALALRREPATMTAYRMESPQLSATLPDPTYAAGGAAARRGPWQTLMQGPAAAGDQARLASLVREIGGGATLSPEAFAERAGAWLQQRHAYSLSPRVPAGDGDVLVRWMESRAAGHCELFAGSFVLLARAAGHPARLVVGFHGGSWNGYSNNLTIHNRDAHAWAEIWDGEGAWLRVDPTPGAAAPMGAVEPTGAAALHEGGDRGWSARVESLRMFWYRRIVNFDQRSQLETLHQVKETVQIIGQTFREMFGQGARSLRRWLGQPWTQARALDGALLMCAAVVLSWLAWRYRTRWRWHKGGRDHRADPVRREAGRWLRKLARVAPDWAVDDPAGREVREALLRLRFGARATWPEPGRVFAQAAALVRQRRSRSRAT
ncbi:MAG: Protein-glutamine gamma-glutamyltransferase [Verrucomicrobia bacterium ADurb.Bin122]|nr:MAG: Protein-glutamine gamma-glutamyltransferase [Verrucomicrobia bacterium ADurb.Bin122]